MKSPDRTVDILIVDDRPENVLALKAILSDPSYHIVSARSGPEALKLLLKKDFALILLDVMMPGMDGYELAELIRNREKTKTVPIIFLTAVAKDNEHMSLGYSVGAVDYLTKPLEADMVRAKVSVFADLFRKTQQIKWQSDLLLEKERREEEFRLREITKAHEKQLSDLVTSIPGIVWEMQVDSNLQEIQMRFVSQYAETLLGYPVQDWISDPKFWLTIIHPKDRQRVIDEMRTSLTNKAAGHLRYRVLKRNGQTIWLESHFMIMLDSSNHAIGLRGVNIDVTAEKQARDDLEAAVRSRDEFLSIASHELKTPITSLSLATQLVRRRAAKNDPQAYAPERMKKLVEQTERQVTQMARLIDDMLDVARIESGKFKLERESMDLSDLLKDVVERLRPQFHAQTGELILKASPSVFGVWDRLRLEQVVINLLTNAVRYGQGKPIEIRLEQRGDWARLSVTDQGVGISPEDQKYIFNRFTRAISANEVSGLGLGLFIAKQIVEDHGGKIWVESNLGQGATFVVEIPCHEQKDSKSRSALSRSNKKDVA